MAEDLQLNNLNSNTHQLVFNSLRNVSFKAVRVVLPGFSFSTGQVDFPNSVFWIPGMKFIPDPVVVSFIVDETMTNYFEALKLMIKAKNAAEEELNDVLEDFTVNLADNHGRQSVALRYTGGFVQGMDSVEVTSTLGSVDQILCTLTLRFQGFEIDTYNGSDKENILDLKL